MEPVSAKRFVIRSADLYLLLGGAEIGFGCVDLRFGDKIFALSVVYFLLGDEAHLLFSNIGETRVGEMRYLVGGLGPLQLIFGSRDFRFAACKHGFGARLVIRHFGNFQRGEEFSLFHAIAHVHINGLDVARNLGHDIDFLIRTKFRREGDAVSHGPWRGFGNSDDGGIGRGGRGRGRFGRRGAGRRQETGHRRGGNAN